MAEGLVSVQLKKGDIARAMRMLRAIPNGFERAAARAVNKTATRARTAVVKAIRDDRPGLPLKATRKNVKLRRASRTFLQARIDIGTFRIPLIQMAPNPKTMEEDLARKRRTGVSYRRSTGGRNRIDEAFVAELASGHIGIYKRLRSGRLPIVELHGPSSAEVFNESAGTAQRVVAQTESNLAADLIVQVDLILARSARR